MSDTEPIITVPVQTSPNVWTRELVCMCPMLHVAIPTTDQYRCERCGFVLEPLVDGEDAAWSVEATGPTCATCGVGCAEEHDIQVVNGMHDQPPSAWYHQRCWPYVEAS